MSLPPPSRSPEDVTVMLSDGSSTGAPPSVAGGFTSTPCRHSVLECSTSCSLPPDSLQARRQMPLFHASAFSGRKQGRGVLVRLAPHGFGFRGL